MGRLCLLFGFTRQAYYQHFWEVEQNSFEQMLIIDEVLRIRKSHKRMGGRKLYELMDEFMLKHQIKMGRDIFFDLLADQNLLVKRRKRKVYTTQSFHWFRKYPNLIREYIPSKPNELWVSDITYWKIKTGFVYISLITDAYSHKIVGAHVAPTLESIETIKALQNALATLKSPAENLIHHSDRGIQYCSSEYVKLLQDNQINISMTENGDPLENEIAERVNGILKEEYLEGYQIDNIEKAKELLNKVITLYNEERPHMSINNLTPEFVHLNNIKTKKIWKNYWTRKTELVNLFQD